MTTIQMWMDDVPQPEESTYEYLSNDLVRFVHRYPGYTFAEMWRFTASTPGKGVLRELLDVQITEWWDELDEDDEAADDDD